MNKKVEQNNKKMFYIINYFQLGETEYNKKKISMNLIKNDHLNKLFKIIKKNFMYIIIKKKCE